MGNLFKTTFCVFSFLILSFSLNSISQEVEEVIVTATKKEESIQDIAVSIQAFDADSIAANQVYDLTAVSYTHLTLPTNREV